MYEIYHATPTFLVIASQAIVQSDFLFYWIWHETGNVKRPLEPCFYLNEWYISWDTYFSFCCSKSVLLTNSTQEIAIVSWPSERCVKPLFDWINGRYISRDAYFSFCRSCFLSSIFFFFLTELATRDRQCQLALTAMCWAFTSTLKGFSIIWWWWPTMGRNKQQCAKDCGTGLETKDR